MTPCVISPQLPFHFEAYVTLKSFLFSRILYSVPFSTHFPSLITWVPFHPLIETQPDFPLEEGIWEDFWAPQFQDFILPMCTSDSPAHFPAKTQRSCCQEVPCPGWRWGGGGRGPAAACAHLSGCGKRTPSFQPIALTSLFKR